jgi:N-acetylmuramoyl-L-alanine amidase
VVPSSRMVSSWSRVLLLIAALPAAATGASAPPQFVIVIDPGHGGRQMGARGPSGLWEKSVSLQVAKKLGQIVEKQMGARVVFTRDRDSEVPLPMRVAKANEAGAELFVSIHGNSMPTERERRTARGVETYFLSADATDEGAQATADRENDEGALAAEEASDDVSAILDDLARTVAHSDSSRLAYLVQHQLSTDLAVPDRGVKQAPFRVLMGAKMPAVLVEIGFVSNPREGKLLADGAYQERIARSIANSIAAFRAEIARRDIDQAAAQSVIHGSP